MFVTTDKYNRDCTPVEIHRSRRDFRGGACHGF